MCSNPEFPSRTYDAVNLNRHSIPTPEREILMIMARGNIDRQTAHYVYRTSARYAESRNRFEVGA